MLGIECPGCWVPTKSDYWESNISRVSRGCEISTHPHADVGLVGGNRDHRHIAALREELGVLEPVSVLCEVIRLAVVHEKGRVRVAHAADGAVCKPWCLYVALAVQSVNLGSDRNLGPLETGLAHVDADNVGGVALGAAQEARLCPDRHLLGSRVLLKEESTDAASGIATGTNLGAVGVDDAHAAGGVVLLLDDDELVAADAALAVREGSGALGLGGRRDGGIGAGIEDNKVVAEAVHLAEGDGPGWQGCRFQGSGD